MRRTIEQDRGAQLLMSADPEIELDRARARLERATVLLTVGDAAPSEWGQATLLTAVECAVRMFRGGVFVVGNLDVQLSVGTEPHGLLRRRLVEAGCLDREAPDHAIRLHVGIDGTSSTFIRCWADGWLATVSASRPETAVHDGNVLSGATAGALAVSECFRRAVMNDPRAGRRTQRISPLTPGEAVASDMALTKLPAKAWLLGLGNLGQAVLWVLGLLPYADPGGVELVLQDPDASAPENLDTQLLTTFGWIGTTKARNASAWAKRRGFFTVVTERRFSASTRRGSEEPGLLFVGVDNVPTRRLAANRQAGFDLVIDAGLGATGAEVFDLRIHSFPGARAPAEAWPADAHGPDAAGTLTPALAKLVDDGRLDRCGAVNIAGSSVGVPTTAVVAAAIQVAQACRAISRSTYCDLIDTTLTDVRRTTAHGARLERTGVLPFQLSRTRGG